MSYVYFTQWLKQTMRLMLENQHTETGEINVPNSTYLKEPTSWSDMLSWTDAEIHQI